MSELDQYDYHLPEELIAQQPLRRRSDARLMLVDRGRQRIDHYHIRDLPELLTPRDALVLNDTRVLPARLTGFRTRTGGRWSGLFLADAPQPAKPSGPSQGGGASAPCRSPGRNIWQVMSKTRGTLQPGEEVTLVDHRGQAALRLEMVADQGGGIWAAVPNCDGETADLLEKVGRVPLPPYIRGGEMVAADVDQYQTVFASKPGAVAAPTAGLHFTDELLARFRAAGISTYRVTLHVGLGTFRPIGVTQLADHTMHREWGTIDQSTADALDAHRRGGGRLVAIGTTSVRVLETAAASGALQAWTGETSLFIRPPYTFRAVDALLTNFHFPRSTLLILVRTFGGDALMRRAYEEAIRENYRFYSYGDAMLII